MMNMPPMQYIPRYSDQPLFDHYPQVPSYLDSTALHPNEFDFLTSPDKTTFNEESMMTNDITAVEASMSLSKTAIKRKRLLEGDDSSGNDDRELTASMRTHVLNSSMATDSQTQSPYKQQLLSTRFVYYRNDRLCLFFMTRLGFSGVTDAELSMLEATQMGTTIEVMVTTTQPSPVKKVVPITTTDKKRRKESNKGVRGKTMSSRGGGCNTMVC
jgi:hypothetical protein